MNFTPNGRTHRLLTRLEQGDCGFYELYQHIHDGVWTNAHRKKLWRLIDVLLVGNLIDWDGRAYVILPAGEDELTRLEAESAPSVRVFARAA